MRIFGLLGILIASALSAGAVISPDEVAVLYNTAVPESRALAEIYRAARDIPEENLVGLEMPAVPDISRAEYETKIAKPLRAEFDRKLWWKRGRDAQGIILPAENQIRVLVTMRGVPLRINASPLPAGFKDDPKNPIDERNEAAVDSELAMFGVEGLPAEGVLQNKFFQSEKGIGGVNLPFLILTARIDAATRATCDRMIRDAVEAEETGLWGRAYVDIANKFPQGDQWLEGVVKANLAAGIPTVVDRFNDTLPKNYPMTDAALYYGWYDGNVSGPFLNSRFQFRKGAVAMHLHSFSAQQLTDGNQNWSAPLLQRGAAVTIGNVFEPYLHLTHYFDTLHKSLLAGNTWVEAAWMAMPVTSWQGVVLGDPLYRPFLHLGGSGKEAAADNDFRALRAAMLEWGATPGERMSQLEKAARRTKSGVLTEAVGLELQSGRAAEAPAWFREAKVCYVKNDDKLRQDFNLVAMDRAANRKDAAVLALRESLTRHGLLPEAEAVKGWLDILDPLAPPPADPTKPPAVGKP